MSSDTSIAVVKFLDWYRHTDVIQAIENLQPRWYNSKKERKKIVRSYNRSKPHKTKFWCMKSAWKTQSEYEEDDDQWMSLEYGVVDVWEFPFILFPTPQKWKQKQRKTG